MSTHKNFDKICVAVLVFALVLTVLFMNGEAFGIEKVVDADNEAHSDLQYFTDNDQNADYDISDACIITLTGDSAELSGDGAYIYDGGVVIANAGTYVISGSLTDGSITVNSNDAAKIWLYFDGVDVSCSDSAALIVENADKVFMTLAEGSVNTLTSGTEYSEDATEAGIDGVVFARDDLTINGSGSLEVKGGCKHGIVANDDMVVTGGNISVTSTGDAIHVNDSLRIRECNMTLESSDDGIQVDNEGGWIYIESGTYAITAVDEGIAATGDITVDGGDFNISVDSSQGHHGIKAGGTFTINDGTMVFTSCYEGIQANYIDICGGDLTIYPADDGLNASSGGSGGMMGMGGGPGMGHGSGDESGLAAGQMDDSGIGHQNGMGPGAVDESGFEMPAMGDESGLAENQMVGPVMGDESGFEMPAMGDESGLSEGQMGGPGMGGQNGMGPGTGDESGLSEGQMGGPVMGGQNGMGPGTGDESGFEMPAMGDESDGMESEASDENEEIPWIHISGGTITIVNENSRDADGLDSNGDIIITGGSIRVSLSGSGGNSAVDYGSESGGVCEISGGDIIACGSYSMAEGFDSTSEQCSILYNMSDGAEAGSVLKLLDSNGNELLSYEVPCSFTSANISCPEMTLGETYTIVIGDMSEEVTLEDVAASYGDAQSTMFGGNMNWGGMQGKGSGGGHGGHGGSGSHGKRASGETDSSVVGQDASGAADSGAVGQDASVETDSGADEQDA